MNLPTLYRVKLVGRRIFARFGGVGLYETAFRVEKTSHVESRPAHVSYQYLLPSEAGGTYINIAEASNHSSVKPDTLRSWCRKKKLISYKDDNGEWWLLRESLDRHLQATNGK